MDGNRPITREALLNMVCMMVRQYFVRRPFSHPVSDFTDAAGFFLQYEFEYTIGQNGRRIGEQDGDVKLKDVYIHALAYFGNNVWRPLLSYIP